MDAFEIVGKAFSVAGLRLREVKLLSIEEPFVKRFLEWFFFSKLDRQAYLSGAKSIYAVSLENRSPWFALAIKSRASDFSQQAILAKAILGRQEKPRDVEKDICELLIDDVERAIAVFKKMGQGKITLELEDMSLPGETWPRSMAVLRDGRGFYETLVGNCLEGDGIGNGENATEDKID